VEVARDVRKRQVYCDSFLRAAHVSRTRLTHQVTAAALYNRRYWACNNCDTDTEEELWNLMNGAQREKRVAPNSSIKSGILIKTPHATYTVIDGATIIQMMKPEAGKTFDEYARQVFIPYISPPAAQCHVWTSFGVFTRMTP